MKKISSFILLCLFSLLTFAQETSESIESSEVNHESWSLETKTWMLVIFAIVSVITVLRTFRNKPDV